MSLEWNLAHLREQLHGWIPAAEDGNNAVPSGVVVTWPGLSVDIPRGWAICDGTNGTPDIRGRFISIMKLTG